MQTPDHLFCFTGTLTRRTQPGTVDDNGDLVEVETTETVRYWLHQLSASEITGLANVEIGDAEIWFPADVDPTGLAELTGSDGGGIWQLIGDGTVRTNPRTQQATYVEARGRSIT